MFGAVALLVLIVLGLYTAHVRSDGQARECMSSKILELEELNAGIRAGSANLQDLLPRLGSATRVDYFQERSAPGSSEEIGEIRLRFEYRCPVLLGQDYVVTENVALRASGSLILGKDAQSFETWH